MNNDLSHKIIPVADLPGHTDRAWHIAWNPTKPILASCSADKTVRVYAYTSLPDSTSPSSSDSLGKKKYKFTPLSNIPTGHAKTVRAVAWAPSGQTLATASFDSNIGIWEREGTVEKLHTHRHGDGCAHGHGEHSHNTEGGDEGGDFDSGEWEWECVSTLEGHETECKSVGYSASGTLLASCSRDKTVWIWEVHSDGDFETISVLMEHAQDVKCVAWHPTEEILASASYDDTIKLYIDDPSDDWFAFATLTGHASTVWSLAWSPAFPSRSDDTTGRSHSYFASSSQDNTVRIWQRTALHKWESVLVLGGHERSVYSVSWGRGIHQPAGEKRDKGYLGWLASASGDGSVLVWELWETPSPSISPASDHPTLNHKLIARLQSAHGVHDVNAVAWCPRTGHEDLLATAADDGGVKVWRVGLGEVQ